MKTIINEFRDKFAFLSNFHPTPVEVDRIIYPTVENAYQAMKTLELELRIPFETVTPGKAKELGNLLEMRNSWDDKKKLIMEHLLRQKFKIEKYKEKLLATGNAILIEGNWWHDNYWGRCHCDKCRPLVTEHTTSNMLGQLLMEIREEIKPITCHTGGAGGVDMLFESLCHDAGFNVVAYSFEDHSTQSNFRKVLDDDELEVVNDMIKKVESLIERKAPFGLEPHIKYIQRDMYQALNSDILFAVGTIDWRFGTPYGGTAWAVGAATMRNIPILFFDQGRLGWYIHNSVFDHQWQPLLEEHIIEKFFTDSLIKDFAGIGTRKLEDSGTTAVYEVVKWYKSKEVT